MRRIATLVAILVFSAFCVNAATMTFVYGSSISSIDMGSDARTGQIYTDQSGNVVAVKAIHENVELGGGKTGKVVEFDKLISRGDYVTGSKLERRGMMSSLSVYGGLYHSMASCSITCPIYPFHPVLMAGVDYDLVSAMKRGSFTVSEALALAGIGVSFPIARLWDSGFTLIENGKVTAWCAAGVGISDSVTFALSYGFSYRHNVGSFHWELGGMWLYRIGGSNLISPYLGFGVDI